MEKKSKDFYLTTCLNVGCMSIRPVSFVVALHKAVDLLFKVLETEVGKDSFNNEIFLFEVKHLVFKTHYYNNAPALKLA